LIALRKCIPLKVMMKKIKFGNVMGFRNGFGYTHNPLIKLGRNIPCPCGSNKKYKRCCEQFLQSYVLESALPEFQKAYDMAMKGEVAW
jgi:hypothetical protein